MSYPPQPGQQPQQPPYQQWPQQQPGWGAPMPPPKKSRTGLIVTLSVLGGLVLLGGCGALVAVVGSSSTHESSATKESPVGTVPEKSAPAESTPAKKPAEKAKKAPAGPEADVKLSNCEVDGMTHWPSAMVEIVNGSKDTSNYIISVEFLDKSGTRVADALAASNDVAAGQKVQTKAQSLDKASGDVTCKVTKVTRYAS
ncbi:FxLYD domain-containing protein [Streptomyces sp. NBC_01108]|uniref:FxLYD domain-containing protein n=1 Tax=Streptomyces sp. NBC_01108 TaxID=2903751 RepID=UPI0038739165|nr:FxLYD domain-containing protein [Streptomyces sp. NBC_01108]